MKSFFHNLKSKSKLHTNSEIVNDTDKCSYFITYDNSFDYANILEVVQEMKEKHAYLVENVRRVHIKHPHEFHDFNGSSFAIVFDVATQNDHIVLKWFENNKLIPNPVVICPKYKQCMQKETLIENIK